MQVYIIQIDTGELFLTKGWDSSNAIERFMQWTIMHEISWESLTTKYLSSDISLGNNDVIPLRV